ncbi:MAG: HYR domain-containing protein [Cyanobacteria bacterium REEB67]|nr:HYR domain-containing protein [Cyanobacteria bacterium REEB67]
MSGKDRNPDAAALGRMLSQEMDRLQELIGPDQLKMAQQTLGGAWQSLGELGRMGKESVKSAVDLISELIRDLTGVVSFIIIPKLPHEIEVDIQMKAENELPYKQPVAPFVDIEAVCIGKRIHFAALVDKEQSGLRCNINEGFSLRFNTPLGKPVVPIKGTMILKRDESKQLVMETTTTVPGTNFPVSVTIPIMQLLKKKKAGLF